jgi:hypothetical protein
MIRLLLTSLILTACAGHGPSSPLARQWDGQARLLQAPAALILTDSLAVAAAPVSLSANAVPEIRTVSPTVGLEDSTRALVRFPLSSDATGYVVRLPSTEGPWLALVVHQPQLRQWSAPVPLAQAYGDAGYSWRGESWLVDLDHDGCFEVVSRWESTEYDLERDSLAPMIRDSLAVMAWRAGHLDVQPVPPGVGLSGVGL